MTTQNWQLTPEQRKELAYLNSKIKAKWHEGKRDLEDVLIEFVIGDIYRRTGKRVVRVDKEK